MAKKKIDPNIKCSKAVEDAMIGFRPRFGDVNDIAIVETFDEIKTLLTLAKEDEERKREMKKITKSKTKRLEEIRRKEQLLLWRISKRGELSTASTGLSPKNSAFPEGSLFK